MRGSFITGTDTEVGKTHFACRYIKELVEQSMRVGVYKPVSSGFLREDRRSDPFRLRNSLGVQGDKVALEKINPYCFLAPLAPPVAARQEGRVIDDELLVSGAQAWHGDCDLLLVEGAGGLFSPITWTMTNADLALRLRFPLILVAENRLGCVHQILSTVRAAQGLGLSIQALVLNQLTSQIDPAQRHNRELLEPFLDALGERFPIWEVPYEHVEDC